ncbi:MAG: hypothetical protein M3Y87_14215 [Myxococcota bacterium]|nr:hypothetical protein [Myxococcota bacterium]
MNTRPVLALLVVSLTCGCSGDAPLPAEPPADSRCEAVCADSATDPTCDPGVRRCEIECNARVEGLTSLCSACLVEGAGRGGTPCLPGGVCCAGGIDYDNGPLDCEASCAGDVGPPVRDPDPRCEALCSTIDEAACASVRSSCYASCQARIAGTSGLCATCLLEGAGVSGTPCLPGEPCCPSGLELRSSVEDCAPICSR